MRPVGTRAPRSRGRGMLAAALLLAALASGAGAAAAAAPVTHTIAIERMAFVPAEVVVRPGDRVVWVNRDPFPHTATSTRRGFDSGSLAPGKSWTWRAQAAGDYDYECTLHTTMKGRVTVR